MDPFERIRELIERGGDGLAALSDEELAELATLVRETGLGVIGGDIEVDDDLGALAELDGYRSTIEDATAARAEAAEERQRQLDDFRARFDPPAEEDPEPEPVAEDAEPADAAAAVDPPAVEVPAEEVEVVMAGGSTPTSAAPSRVRISGVNARRPASYQPSGNAVNRAALTASVNLPGFQGGTKLDNRDRIWQAFQTAGDLAMTASPAPGREVKIPVASAVANIPQSLMLDRDAEQNMEKINARTSLAALTASGGICAPVPYSYDLNTWGDSGRPVRDALARFGAVRGGIRTIAPPIIDDVANAFGVWTNANDITPAAPTTKPCLTIACNNTDTTTLVYAVTMCFQIGNFRDRWYPEQVDAIMRLADVYGARYAESKLLAGIAAGSEVVTYGAANTPVVSSVHDVHFAVTRLLAGIRYRHRIARGQRIRVIGFEWVRDVLISDLVRKNEGAMSLDEKLSMAASEVDDWFAVHNASVTWSPDFQFGQAADAGGGPGAGAQNAGALADWPAMARFYVFPEGGWLFLDGGELNLGVIRDATLVGTNDMKMFSETFENVHYNGPASETYVLDVGICPTGELIVPSKAPGACT